MRSKPIRIQHVRLWAAMFLTALAMACTTTTQAGLEEGLVSYYPLDDVAGVKTPDVIHGYDMELVNLTAADLVAGKVGKAMHFENARSTMLKRVSTPGELLPINQHPAVTIAFWVNVTGTGQTDLRLFSEASTENNNPLFNLGTASDAASGKVDFYFRQAPWTTVNHLRTEGEPLDGTWHHIAFVQQEDGTRAFYIDGALDPVAIPAKEAGDWNINTTTIGGILRASATHQVTGDIDEVMLWSRALSEVELQQVVAEGLDSVIPPMTKGMVAYWPLDEVTGVKTPDLAKGYDMELVNLTAADLVPGKWGQAMHFENARQTMLKRVSAPGEQLPINQYPALTISFWVNVVGTGQTDLRLFSEASNENNNPLFNLGTASDAASGKVDFYFRQDPWTTVNHLRTEGEPLNGTWHHIAFVQQEDGTRAFYIDGALDPVAIPAKEAGAWNVNTTTIGGILRASATHQVTGDIDDVALWNRALSEAEITTLATTGTPVPFSIVQPLAIRSFKADLPAAAVGDTVVLRWDVTKSVEVTIDQGVGDVTAQTVSGVGSTEVTLDATRTFTLTLRRGEETLSQSITVAAIDGVAQGWTLIDNFDRYPVGQLSGNGGWADLDAIDWNIVELNGNRFLSPTNGADGIAVLPLGPLTVSEGQERTLFFRFYTSADEIPDIVGLVALTDRPVRFGSDIGPNIGPGALIERTYAGGVQTYGLYVGGYDDVPLAFYDYPLFPATGLDETVVYNVWVDITNGPFEYDQSDPPVATDVGDTYSVYLQKDGDATRLKVISDFASQRDPVGAADSGWTTKDLTRLIVGTPDGHMVSDPVLPPTLYIDDLYLSKGGFNNTVPRAFGFTTPVEPSEPPTLTIAQDGAEVQIEWSDGTLESSTTVTGGWAPVAGATSPYRLAPTDSQRFFRAKR